WVRIDGAGDDASLFTMFQQERVLFVTKPRLTPNLWEAASKVKDWRAVDWDAFDKPDHRGCRHCVRAAELARGRRERARDRGAYAGTASRPTALPVGRARLDGEALPHQQRRSGVHGYRLGSRPRVMRGA